MIVKDVERPPRILMGNDAKIAAALERIAPVAHGKLIRRLRPE